MNTYSIHINGIVQGVGFRPMVFQLAREMELTGYVKNGSDGVRIIFNAGEQEASIFFQKIKDAAPVNSVIISAECKPTVAQSFNDFSILVEEKDSSEKQVLIPPDIALCDDCRRELHSQEDRRYRYPFITCTHCGPRYSIMQSIPYERKNTSMEYFDMCDACLKEYKTVTDRRFFSQTNSCRDCGIHLSLRNSSSPEVKHSTEEILQSINDFLELGKIVAIKGVGGYLLLCDAGNPGTIQLLRQRKHRPAKPFAVLYPSFESVEKDFELNEKERTLIESKEAPIVLLRPKKKTVNHLCTLQIAPALSRVGVMLPYSPLLDLVATDFGKPLIATSGNVSGSPIIYKEEDAITCLSEIADHIVDYNRHIIVPEDDSVVQVAKHSLQQIILRRSRGFAPSFLDYKPSKSECVLSTGALMKSSFSLSVNGNVFVSQFLGSGESYESQQMYRKTLSHWFDVYKVKPGIIITDMHPGYFSHQFAIELAAAQGSALKFAQHHEAHFASVLAENNLLNTNKPILGVIWDGTGLGHDGNIWGGEFFRYENNEMQRCYHFDYIPTIAGDKMAREPRIAALCATNNIWSPSIALEDKFSFVEWNNYRSLIASTSLNTSSVGRIFDAVASLLNICDKQSYEGEAAMYLQVLAGEYVDKNGFDMNDSYFEEEPDCCEIPTDSLMWGIVYDIESGKENDYIAAKFHYSLVRLVGIVAQCTGTENICFSGGVFQNALLVDWILHEYRNKYQLFFNKKLSPNDENISFGQLAYYDNDIKTKKEEIKRVNVIPGQRL